MEDRRTAARRGVESNELRETTMEPNVPKPRPSRPRPRFPVRTTSDSGEGGGGGIWGWVIFILIFGVGNAILYATTGWILIPK
jgi:hypothetical protein